MIGARQPGTTGPMNRSATALCLLSLLTAGCQSVAGSADGDALLAKYVTVPLRVDTGGLSPDQRALLDHVRAAAQIMDGLFWQQAYGDRAALLSSIDDPALRRFAEINYGPWDRLDGNAPFVAGVGEKPKGAGFYPRDMTVAEFEAATALASDAGDALRGLYTMVRRDASGALVAVPYHEYFAEPLRRAAGELRAAAALAEDEGLRRYLELRADALLTGDYRASDMAWLDMRDNAVDVVIGPIETYEDQLFGAKAAFEAYVLVVDRDWSRRLGRYAALLPGLQRDLPVDAAYKQEEPGSDAQLGAYDVLFYAGDCNAGSKTIAINLPNDEAVQLAKGTRRLQLKNAMRAKFDRILLPITERLIAPEQREHVTFDAFFANTMFHEVAHGLGIKRTLDGRGTVREALAEQASAIEEGKADVLGLWMITRLHEQGELGETDLRDNYVTFLASVFRSIRFGAASAHGRANLTRFAFFAERGAFTRRADGTYAVDFERMQDATEALSARILQLQGDGDRAGALAFGARYGKLGPELQADLDRLAAAGIPVDVVFEQ